MDCFSMVLRAYWVLLSNLRVHTWTLAKFPLPISLPIFSSSLRSSRMAQGFRA